MRETVAASEVHADWPGFADLYCEHAAHVNRFCLSQLGDAGAAEDITHETFLRAFRVQPGRRPAGDLRPWLIRIARHLCIDHYRRAGRMRRLLARLGTTSQTPPSVEVVAEDRDRLHQVHIELQRLRQRERELIGLRVAADMSYREIGEVLNMGEDAAKVATNRALSRLRTHLQEVPSHRDS